MSGSKSSELRLNVNMNDKCVKDKDEENILFRHSVASPVKFDEIIWIIHFRLYNTVSEMIQE